MKFSLSSLYLQGQPFRVLLDSIVSSNVENWEIVDEDTHRLNEARAKSLQRLRSRLGLNYTVHAPFEDQNIASLNKKHRDSDIVRLLSSLEFAAKIDAEIWVVHPGLYSGLSWAYPGRQWTLNLEALELLREKAEDLGLRVAVENMPYNFFILSSHRDFEAFFAERSMRAAKMTFDVGHANTLGEVETLLRRFGDRIVHIHLHDNYGTHDEHNMIGRGTVDWVTLARFLRRRRFAGCLVVESVNRTIESYRKAGEILDCYW